MKKVLIISPHFPPSNAADMHRIRMSLPYFKAMGWDAEVVTVDQNYYNLVKDPLLLKSVPSTSVVHEVKALSKKWTSKLGLGSLALRSLFFYKRAVNRLLRKEKYDLIYFSTTEFPLCVLGAYWYKKFNIPYIIDMQDPWHSDYYKDKPKEKQPKKYWFSYRMHKFLEPIAMKNVSGIISVSTIYIENLQNRYPHLKQKPCSVITFGAFDLDFEIARENEDQLCLKYEKSPEIINLVYVGRGGFDMEKSIHLIFESFKKGLEENRALFAQVRFHFIGTSYAPAGKAIPTIAPIAEKFGISAYVNEITDRIGFYDSIKNLTCADGLVIIGSNDPGYTASKLYPYILAKKQLLAVFNPSSSVVQILKDCNAGDLIVHGETLTNSYEMLRNFIQKVQQQEKPSTKWDVFRPYTAEFLTQKQVEVFNKAIGNIN